ncbi:endolytic transglycosylase MltG [Streptomyces sp. Ru73]|uniref:endolytic transglycosylase MltG n=1 Tax=Streptomyces sp. Ru73 TaxID=2080748 RepID=UPI000CDDC592|nr:endolytic transglycosylase MltG [Streptomyces sp. Ru73]POX36947.1 endolytic transglycosylase MltG [Streptomyces sp. Ru73]
MTEYGRGHGSEPWHPEDPLYGESYGDQGAYGGQASYGSQDPYAGQQQPGWGGAPGRQQYPYEQQYDQRYEQQQYDPYGQAGGHAGQGGAPYDPYGQQADPYGQQHDPYGQQPGPYNSAVPDPYGAPDGYPAPHQQQHPQQPQYQQQHQQVRHDQTAPMPVVPGGAPADDWEADQDAPWQDEPAPDRHEPEHSFFADRADEDPEDEPAPRGKRRPGGERRGKDQRPKRRGRAVAAVVALAVIGGGGYLAYDRFAPPPDFDGQGTGSIQVEIPDGSPVLQMGLLLKKEGVVKSADAFTAAVSENPKAKAGLQPGVYTLRKEMSAASAVDLMLSPKSRNGLTIPEGMRAVAVYERIDKKLGLKAGTTQDVARSEAKNLGLPAWADDDPDIKDPLEGFLYPSVYEVSKKSKPEDVLKQMVARAKQNYARYDLAANAKKFGLKSPLQLVTVASLTQAEGTSHDDFRKMAEVVYNRLDPANHETYGKLEFDSTYNYIKNQSELDIPISAIKNYDNPYNTYYYKGLPPGPIGNPGEDALKAAVNPTDEGWYYFVAINGKTKFAKTYAEHEKLVAEFNKTR